MNQRGTRGMLPKLLQELPQEGAPVRLSGQRRIRPPESKASDQLKISGRTDHGNRFGVGFIDGGFAWPSRPLKPWLVRGHGVPWRYPRASATTNSVISPIDLTPACRAIPPTHKRIPLVSKEWQGWRSWRCGTHLPDAGRE